MGSWTLDGIREASRPRSMLCSVEQERGIFRMDLSTEFGKEIPSRNLREKRSVYRSIQFDYTQTLFLGGINFQLQIQNLAARRINFHYRDRSVGISAENLSLQIQILS